MNKNQHIFSLTLPLVMISIFFSIQDAFAQKEGTKHPDKNALKYSYQYPKTWQGLKFSEHKTFLERSYFSIGMKINEIWGLSDILGGSALGVNSIASFGHWIAPVHGVEINFGLGVLPSIFWELDNKQEAYHNPFLTRYWSAGLTYMMHLSSYASKIETFRYVEFIGLFGLNLRKFEEYSIDTNIGLRLKCNLPQNIGIGIYVEPSVSIFNNKLDNGNPNKLSTQVTPSISAGFSVCLSNIYDYRKKNKTERLSINNPKNTSSSLNIKTNMLHWLVLAPNIGLEYRFRDHWSVGSSVSTAWWKNEPTHKYYQILICELEGRRYLGSRNNHHFGVYTQGGLYDVEFESIGKIGEFFSIGISYGYLLPISNYLSLSFEIGAGYTNTTYREYEYSGNDSLYEYLRTRRTHLFIPSKIGISLVMDLLRFKKKGGLR